MQNHRHVFRRFSSVLLVPLFSLSLMPASNTVHAGTRPVARLEYRVEVTDLASHTLHVTLDFVPACLQSDSIPHSHQLHGVPLYMDNPTVAAVDSAVRNLRVRDLQGTLRPAPRLENAKDMPLPHPSWDVPIHEPLRIEYDLVARFQESDQTRRYGILIPYMDAPQAWLYGNTVFCVPQLGGTLHESSTMPADIRVIFDVPESIPLVAVRDTTDLHNIYELMSLQFGMGSFISDHGTAKHATFTLLYPQDGHFNEFERQALQQVTRESLNATTSFFGAAPFSHFTLLYFRRAGMGGLEGSNATHIYMPTRLGVADQSSAGTRALYSVILHEVFHTWNPVFLTATEDPWIKEGATSYVDLVLSGRLGYLSTEDIAARWQRTIELLEKQTALQPIALSDERLWTREYDGEDWRLVTYERGKAVALLLDLHIREATGNHRSLQDLFAALYRDHVHRGFDRRALLDTVHEITGQAAAGFFAEYVDTTVPLAADTLREAVRRATELGLWKSEKPRRDNPYQ